MQDKKPKLKPSRVNINDKDKEANLLSKLNMLFKSNLNNNAKVLEKTRNKLSNLNNNNVNTYADRNHLVLKLTSKEKMNSQNLNNIKNNNHYNDNYDKNYCLQNKEKEIKNLAYNLTGKLKRVKSEIPGINSNSKKLLPAEDPKKLDNYAYINNMKNACNKYPNILIPRKADQSAKLEYYKNLLDFIKVENKPNMSSNGITDNILFIKNNNKMKLAKNKNQKSNNFSTTLIQNNNIDNKNIPFIEKYKFSIYSSVRLTLHKIYNKTPAEHSKLVVENLMFNKNCHLVSVFKDSMIADYLNEFLNRYYMLQESRERLPKLFNYYKNYLMFFAKPIFRDLKAHAVVQAYGDYKAENYYNRNYGRNQGNKEVDRRDPANSNNNNNYNNLKIFDTKLQISLDKKSLYLKETLLSTNYNYTNNNSRMQNKNRDSYSIENKFVDESNFKYYIVSNTQGEYKKINCTENKDVYRNEESNRLNHTISEFLRVDNNFDYSINFNNNNNNIPFYPNFNISKIYNNANNEETQYIGHCDKKTTFEDAFADKKKNHLKFKNGDEIKNNKKTKTKTLKKNKEAANIENYASEKKHKLKNQSKENFSYANKCNEESVLSLLKYLDCENDHKKNLTNNKSDCRDNIRSINPTKKIIYNSATHSNNSNNLKTCTVTSSPWKANEDTQPDPDFIKNKHKENSSLKASSVNSLKEKNSGSDITYPSKLVKAVDGGINSVINNCSNNIATGNAPIQNIPFTITGDNAYSFIHPLNIENPYIINKAEAHAKTNLLTNAKNIQNIQNPDYITDIDKKYNLINTNFEKISKQNKSFNNNFLTRNPTFDNKFLKNINSENRDSAIFTVSSSFNSVELRKNSSPKTKMQSRNKDLFQSSLNALSYGADSKPEHLAEAVNKKSGLTISIFNSEGKNIDVKFLPMLELFHNSNVADKLYSAKEKKISKLNPILHNSRKIKKTKGQRNSISELSNINNKSKSDNANKNYQSNFNKSHNSKIISCASEIRKGDKSAHEAHHPFMTYQIQYPEKLNKEFKGLKSYSSNQQKNDSQINLGKENKHSTEISTKASGDTNININTLTFNTQTYNKTLPLTNIDSVNSKAYIINKNQTYRKPIHNYNEPIKNKNLSGADKYEEKKQICNKSPNQVRVINQKTENISFNYKTNSRNINNNCSASKNLYYHTQHKVLSSNSKLNSNYFSPRNSNFCQDNSSQYKTLQAEYLIKLDFNNKKATEADEKKHTASLFNQSGLISLKANRASSNNRATKLQDKSKNLSPELILQQVKINSDKNYFHSNTQFIFTDNIINSNPLNVYEKALNIDYNENSKNKTLLIIKDKEKDILNPSTGLVRIDYNLAEKKKSNKAINLNQLKKFNNLITFNSKQQIKIDEQITKNLSLSVSSSKINNKATSSNFSDALLKQNKLGFCAETNNYNKVAIKSLNELKEASTINKTKDIKDSNKLVDKNIVGILPLNENSASKSNNTNQTSSSHAAATAANNSINLRNIAEKNESLSRNKNQALLMNTTNRASQEHNSYTNSINNKSNKNVLSYDESNSKITKKTTYSKTNSNNIVCNNNLNHNDYVRNLNLAINMHSMLGNFNFGNFGKDKASQVVNANSNNNTDRNQKINKGINTKSPNNKVYNFKIPNFFEKNETDLTETINNIQITDRLVTKEPSNLISKKGTIYDDNKLTGKFENQNKLLFIKKIMDENKIKVGSSSYKYAASPTLKINSNFLRESHINGGFISNRNSNSNKNCNFYGKENVSSQKQKLITRIATSGSNQQLNSNYNKY